MVSCVCLHFFQTLQNCSCENKNNSESEDNQLVVLVKRSGRLSQPLCLYSDYATLLLIKPELGYYKNIKDLAMDEALMEGMMIEYGIEGVGPKIGGGFSNTK